tara:strand:- start:1776 stop:2264 length:489 start_codon:yes stop_codon:yes gene_type:complete
MLILIEDKHVKEKNISLLEGVKNTSRPGCQFMKLSYSTEKFVMNGLFMCITLREIDVWKVSGDVLHIRMNSEDNISLLRKLQDIEEYIYEIATKASQLERTNSIRNVVKRVKTKGVAKELGVGYYAEMSCILRILGLWYDSGKCGVNYQLVTNKTPYKVNLI